MKTKVWILAFSVVWMFFSCASEKKAELVTEGDCIVIPFEKGVGNVRPVKLSEIAEKVTFVPLETTESSLVAKQKLDNVRLANGRIYVPCSEGLLTFDEKTGKFLHRISRKGQGPGEFFIVDGGIIDERNKRVYLSDMVLDHLVAYDWNGKHLPDESIQLLMVPSWKEVYLNENKDSVLVFVSPKEAGTLPRFRNSIEVEADAYLCWQQDLKGNVSKSISSGHLAMPNDINAHNRIYVSHVKKDSPIYTFCVKQTKVYLKDTLYHYNKTTNHFYPAYTTNFPHNECNLVFSTESPLHYYTTYQRYKEGELIAPQNMEANRLVQVEKKTGKARYIRLVNDYLGGLEVSGVNFRHFMKDNYVFFRFNDALKLKEQLEEALNKNASMDNSIRERIARLKDSLHEDSNDVIVLCTFKK